MALNVWSLKMRNAGTRRLRASSNRQVCSASSTRESAATGVRFIFGAAGSFTTVPGLRFREGGVFLLRFRFVDGAAFLGPLKVAQIPPLF